MTFGKGASKTHHILLWIGGGMIAAAIKAMIKTRGNIDRNKVDLRPNINLAAAGLLSWT